MLVHQALDRAASTDPDGVALRWPHGSWTHADLARASAGLAATLAGREVGPGDVVGIHLPKGPEGVAAMYGAMRAGAAFMAMDPQAPPTYVADLAERARVAVLVTGGGLDRGWGPWLARSAVRAVVTVDPRTELRGAIPFEVAAAAGSPGSPPGPVAPEDPAAVYATSGSTGRAKLVVHAHRALEDVAAWVVDRLRLSPDDRLAVHPPLHFVLSAYALFPTPRAGARSVLVPEEHTVLGWELARTVRDDAVTVLVCTPSALALMRPAELPPGTLRSLRAILLSGEAPSVEVLRAVRRAAPDAELWNLYGTTETWGIARCRLGDAELARDRIPLGSAWEGARIAVVRADGGRAGPGDEGELFVRSPRLLLRYLDEPDTVGAPVEDPTASIEGLGYRTGDVVRVLGDGTYEMAGRRDRQVGRRGQRVDLSEVDAALGADPRVGEVAAVASTAIAGAEGSEVGGTVVIAFVVPAAAPPPTAGELHDALAGRVPRRLVPDRIEIVDALPRTSSGKVDLMALERRARSG